MITNRNMIMSNIMTIVVTLKVFLEGTEGAMGVVRATTGLIAFCSPLCTCSNPHVDRCSNPLPWDPLTSPYKHADEAVDCQDSSKGGAVETGCSGSHHIIGCFII